MFGTVKTIVKKEKVKSFITKSNSILKQEKLSQEEALQMLYDVSEKADWNIDTILSDTIKEIENRRVRNRFRRFLISEKYSILIDYRDTADYYIDYAGDDCVLVNSPCIIRDNKLIKPQSTIVLSPNGEIKIPEGQVCLFEMTRTIHGFTARWNDLDGLYTTKGTPLFPCIFDHVENEICLRSGELVYKGYEYLYNLIGTVSDPETFRLVSFYPYTIVFQCDNKIYDLRCVGFKNDGVKYSGAWTYYTDDTDDAYKKLPEEEKWRLELENVNELREVMSSYHHVFTEEELRELGAND